MLRTWLRSTTTRSLPASSRPVPGVLPLTLAFGWKRVVPLLILTGDRDVPVPLDGVQEIFGRAPEPRRMFVLRRADHEHFADDVEGSHEALGWPASGRHSRREWADNELGPRADCLAASLPCRPAGGLDGL